MKIGLVWFLIYNHFHHIDPLYLFLCHETVHGAFFTFLGFIKMVTNCTYEKIQEKISCDQHEHDEIQAKNKTIIQFRSYIR